jgi:hypothetical protein
LPTFHPTSTLRRKFITPIVRISADQDAPFFGYPRKLLKSSEGIQYPVYQVNGNNAVECSVSKWQPQCVSLGKIYILDPETSKAATLDWDVMGGVARRAWARNSPALETVASWNEKNEGRGHITVPSLADDELLDRVVDKVFRSS